MGKRFTSPNTKSEELTEHTIQQRLNYFFASHKYKADGLYVFEWESDKLIWTNSGYIYEFEIKISRSDFKNDFKHKKDKHIILNGPTDKDQMMPGFYEHFERNQKIYASIDEMKAKLKPTDSYYIANHRKPNYFYYAVPEGLIQPEEVPPYAGLVYIMKEYRYVAQSFCIVKKAPQLHKEKYKDAELNLGEKFYYNWQTALRNLRDVARRADTTEGKLKRELERQHHDRTWEDMERELADAKENRELYQRRYYEYQHNANCDRQEIRLLRRELLKMKPDFDYKAIEREAEKYYGRRTPIG